MSDSTLWRAFPSHLERTGPRQLTGRLVPYNLPADVADQRPDGTFEVYREGFHSGAFEPQVKLRDKLAKIGLVHRHEGGLGFLGPFTALREQEDGLYGDVAVLRSRADDVEDLLAAGVNELSVEFRLRKGAHTTVDDAGVRWRVMAHLDAVALEAKGAYSHAQVLAFRAELDDEVKAQAEAQAAADAEQERLASETAERERAEAAVTEALERRRRWDEMAARLPAEEERQGALVRDYGIMAPARLSHHR